MNITDINGVVFRFDLYNLNFFKDCDTEISGHYTFWYHKPSNSFVYCKMGDYANLVSIRPVKENPRKIEDKNKDLLDSLLSKSIRCAYYWNYNCSQQRGRYLLDELEETCEKGFCGRPITEGCEYFKHKHDEYYDHVMKINCIFPVEYNHEDKHLKSKDLQAISLFC